MNAAFYIAAAVATAATLFTITRSNAMHALLYLIVSLLALALVFFTLGAPFAALLEVIVYAGAIIVLFVFVIMMLNLSEATISREREWLAPAGWIGPSLLCAVLLAELIYVLRSGEAAPQPAEVVSAQAVGAALFGTYLLAVELASMLLLAGLIGAFWLGNALNRREEAALRSAAAAPLAPRAPR